MGVTRVEEISRNGFTVQAHFRIGRGAHIEPGALDARPHGERPPQHRRGDEILVMGIGDPAGLPFGGLHQGGFELRNGRYDPPAASVPRFDPPVIRGPRDKQSAVGHRGKRTAAGDLPGIPDVGMIQFLGRRSHAEAVTGLHERIGIFISPGKAGRRSVHRDRRSEVFAAHVGDRGTLPAGTRQQRQAAQREPASGGSEICNIHRIRKLLGFYRFSGFIPDNVRTEAVAADAEAAAVLDGSHPQMAAEHVGKIGSVAVIEPEGDLLDAHGRSRQQAASLL